MIVPLTEKQQIALSWIESYVDENGFSPSRNEICVHMGYKSPNAAQCLLNALEKKGFIKIQRVKARGITLLNKSNKKVFDSEKVREAVTVERVSKGVKITVQGKDIILGEIQARALQMNIGRALSARAA